MLHLCAPPDSNPPLTNSFICRRILENSDHYLVEVKRTGNDGFLNHFHWLKISKDFTQVSGLSLKTIDASYNVEERFFEEGYLKFDSTTGIFIEKFNSGQHHYQLLNNLEVNKGFIRIFESYFSESKSLTN